MSRGLCAVCEQPITKGMQFVIERTEAIHRGCVGGITRLARVEADLARARANAIQSQGAHDAEVIRLQAELARARQLVTDRNGEIAMARLERDHARQEAAAAAHVNEGVIAENQRLQGEISRATAERDQLRQKIGTDKAPTNDDRDATAVRFSLLELDAT